MFGRFAGVVESPVPRRGQVLAWLLATVIAVSALGAASLGINPAAAAQGYIVTADIVDNPTRIDLGKVTPSI